MSDRLLKSAAAALVCCLLLATCTVTGQSVGCYETLRMMADSGQPGSWHRVNDLRPGLDVKTIARESVKRLNADNGDRKVYELLTDELGNLVDFSTLEKV
jgi:hypothetical protein